jgi:hypothetical protein
MPNQALVTAKLAAAKACLLKKDGSDKTVLLLSIRELYPKLT